MGQGEGRPKEREQGKGALSRRAEGTSLAVQGLQLFVLNLLDMPSQKQPKAPGGLPVPGRWTHLSPTRAPRTWPCNDGDKELGFCILGVPPGASWRP